MPANGSEDKNESLPGKGWLAGLVAAVIILFWDRSKFFEAGSWWSKATGQEQLVFGVAFILSLLVAFPVFAGVAAIFSKRWRQQFWKPKLTRFPLRVIRTSTYNELKARPKRAPGSGLRVSIPGVVRYGDLETHEDMRTHVLRVQWRNNTVIGELHPTNGNAYRVIYGQLEDSRFSKNFEPDVELGRADDPAKGVEMLRIKDLEEAKKAEKE